MRLSVLILLFLSWAGCSSVGTTVVHVPESGPDGVVSFIIVQMNDVYEITPVEGGRSGGMARVATILDRLKEESPRVYTVIGGDFLSPSALGTARVDGERLRGRQMVDVLNALGLDLATYGNHEFDLDEDDLLRRVEESDFAWVSSNVTDDEGMPLSKTTPRLIIRFTDEEGDEARVGFVGATLDSNPVDYVAYQEPIAAIKAQVEALEGQADVIVALTHLALEDDIRVAAEIPEIDVVMGGHEHENVEVYRGADFTPVFKADANARSLYVHRFTYDTRTNQVSVTSELLPVTNAVPDDPAVADVVDAWVELAFSGFVEQGFDPEAVVTTTPEALDGRESTIRNRPTNLGTLIAESFLQEADDADLALFNSGSVRIDDVLPAGRVTQYDLIRIMPFGGFVQTVRIRGDVLERALNQGEANRGTGGYLQTANVSTSDGTWMIGGEAIDPNRGYRVATSDFLVSGLETNMAFFNVEENPDMELLATHRDVRMAALAELQRRYGTP